MKYEKKKIVTYKITTETVEARKMVWFEEEYSSAKIYLPHNLLCGNRCQYLNSSCVDCKKAHHITTTQKSRAVSLNINQKVSADNNESFLRFPTSVEEHFIRITGWVTMRDVDILQIHKHAFLFW
jgi:hypothetical protein